MIVLSLLHAKYTISIFWENSEKPCIKQWLANLSHCLALEKLTFAIRGKSHTFYKMWGEFLEFFRI